MPLTDVSDMFYSLIIITGPEGNSAQQARVRETGAIRRSADH
jgi:hypothetical protein